MNELGNTYSFGVYDDPCLAGRYAGMHKFVAYINTATFVGYLDFDTGKYVLESASDFNYTDYMCLEAIIHHFNNI